MALDPEEAAIADICKLVKVENTGWCCDDITCWYHFTYEGGRLSVYYKR